jgi:hypothetical protein
LCARQRMACDGRDLGERPARLGIVTVLPLISWK